jgi:hypothetical protein
MRDPDRLLEQGMEHVRLSPFTLEGFYRARERRRRHQRQAALVVGLAIAAVVILGTISVLPRASTAPASGPPNTRASVIPSTPAPVTTDLSGTWSGSYDGFVGNDKASYLGTPNGTFTLTWAQTGNDLSGTIRLKSGGIQDISGTIEGRTIQFGTPGFEGITFTGVVKENSMAGQYEVGGSARGTWTAHKTQ